MLRFLLTAILSFSNWYWFRFWLIVVWFIVVFYCSASVECYILTQFDRSRCSKQRSSDDRSSNSPYFKYSGSAWSDQESNNLLRCLSQSISILVSNLWRLQLEINWLYKKRLILVCVSIRISVNIIKVDSFLSVLETITNSSLKIETKNKFCCCVFMVDRNFK